MGMFEDAKDKAEEAKDDVVNKFHEEKGRMEGKKEQEERDNDRQLKDDEYEPEEKAV